MIRGRHRLLEAGALALVLAAMGAPRTALADEGTDTVYLKSGGVVRGAVMEYDPGGEARVRLADGTVRTIPAGLIARVAMAADRPAPVAPAAAPAPAGPTAPTGPTAQLHVEGSREVEIVGRPNDGYEWAPICQAPCDREVHLDWEYLARGTAIRPSAPFQLHGSDGQRVAVAVDPASTTWFVLGVIGAIGGSSITLVGLSVMGIGALAQSAGNDGTTTSRSTADAGGSILLAGGVITGVGVFLLVGGGIAALSNWSTHVTPLDTKEALPAPRLPTWRSAETPGAMPAPMALTTPLYAVHF